MNTIWTGTAPGASPKTRSATPTTRCCPRRWSAGRCTLFGSLLPRHLEIIYEINRRFLDEVRRRYPGRRRAHRAHVADRRAWRALRPHGQPRVRGQPRHQRRRPAAHRAAQGGACCAISTSSRREKFSNKTNGVTPRRFLLLSNPRLAELDHSQHRRSLGQAPGRAAQARSLRR